MLRDYQIDLKNATYAAWSQPNVKNIMQVCPTGGGKTVLFCDIVKEQQRPTCVIAHRQELVSQGSLALNREEVPHSLIGPKELVRQIVLLHHETHGRSFYSARASVRVAGVHTLTARGVGKDRWFDHVGLVVQDEGHHVLKANMWGKAMSLFPNANGLFVTAHALRADGAGLGRHADGLADALVLGPPARELIDRGYLCDYRLICPPTDVHLTDADIGSTGDYSLPKLRAAVHGSTQIVGDVVKHYKKFADGKLGLTFCVDVESAKEIAAEFRRQGIPAEIITGDTPIHVRSTFMRRFRNREILQLVSVDVLGEGTDVPAVEVISMARPTASFQLYAQQFGRGLRTMIAPDIAMYWDQYTDAQRKEFIKVSAKPRAIIIDHVNNWQRHGLPDAPRLYTLSSNERKSRQSQPDAIPLRHCLNTECLQPYERHLLKCPYCGTYPTLLGRSAPEMVDGDLIELDADTLKQLRGEVDRVDAAPRIPRDASPETASAIKRNWRERQETQGTLRDAIALWGGYQTHCGLSIREAQKLFFLRFGADVLSAKALNKADATELYQRVQNEILRHNVVKA